MIRYQAAALALKAFSTNSTTRAVYRTLGNRLKDHASVDIDSYVQKAAWLLMRLPSTTISRAAEIGTGWMHFYGIVLALSGVKEVDLYDVWDNRQLQRLKRAFCGLERNFSALGIPDYEQAAALSKLDAISRAKSFADIYTALGLSYSLASVCRRDYDLVCSMDVLEHVDADLLPGLIRHIYSSLRPGGISLHQIGLDDHLAHYDRHASTKQYLSISEDYWQRWYANRVQYFNRVPVDALRRIFLEAGFEQIECSVTIDKLALEGIEIAPQFRDQPKESLLAVRGYFVHRRPA
jgi:SAM-dependent methyltransferase